MALVALSSSCTSPAPCMLTPATVSTFPAQATLQIDTTGASPANLNLSITGSVAGGNTHTASLTLPIVAFGLGTVTSPQAASAGGSANFSVQLVSENGYTGTVQTSCDATSLSQNQTCTLSPTSATLTANGTTTIQGQITVPQGQAPGSYPIKFSAVDGSYSALSATQNFSLTVQGAPTFQIAVTPASTSLNAGQTTSNIGISITPQSGFTGSVNLTCASLPSLSTCTFSPATVKVSGKFHPSHNADFHDSSQQRGDTPGASWTEVFCFCCGATAGRAVSVGVEYEMRKKKKKEDEERHYRRAGLASNADGDPACLWRFWRHIKRPTSSAVTGDPIRNVHDRCVRNVEQHHPKH